MRRLPAIIILSILACCGGLFVLYILGSRFGPSASTVAVAGSLGGAAGATATAIARLAEAVLIDANFWMGKAPADFDARFGPSAAPRPVGQGRESRTYTTPWGTFDAVFEGGKAIELLIYPQRARRPKSFDGGLNAVNLPTGQRPDSQGTRARTWSNLNGYSVQVTAPSGQDIESIVVGRAGP